jgi:hypothetical protein
VPTRSLARRLSIALLVLEGLPGLVVGATLYGAILGQPGVGAGYLIALGLIVYGIASLAGAIGLLFGRRWAAPIALVTVVVGLVVLVVVLAIAGGRDEVIGGGILLWVATLAVLVVGLVEDRRGR